MLLFLAIMKFTPHQRRNPIQNTSALKQTRVVMQKYEAMRLILCDYEKARNNINFVIAEINEIVYHILLYAKTNKFCPDLIDRRDREKFDSFYDDLKSNLISQLQSYEKCNRLMENIENNQDKTDFTNWWELFRYNMTVFKNIKNSEIRLIIDQINKASEPMNSLEHHDLEPIYINIVIYDKTLKLLECAIGKNQTTSDRDRKMAELKVYCVFNRQNFYRES